MQKVFSLFSIYGKVVCAICFAQWKRESGIGIGIGIYLVIIHSKNDKLKYNKYLHDYNNTLYV